MAPDAQKALAKFDMCLPKEVLVNPQIFSVRTIDIDNNIEKFYQRFYMNMDRTKFDNFLISLIPDNVEVCKNSVCKKVSKVEDKYFVEFETENGRRTENSRIVIGADGANSIIRNVFYKKVKIKKYVSIQEWYKNTNVSPFYSCIFDRKITDSYSWTISKGDYFIIGGAFPMKDSNKRFELLKATVKEKGIEFDNKEKREGCFVYISKGIGSICTGKNGVYLVRRSGRDD